MTGATGVACGLLQCKPIHGSHGITMTLNDPQLIARFKIHLRRVTGIHLNTQRLLDDPVYAKCMIDLAESETDETLATLVVQLRHGSNGSAVRRRARGRSKDHAARFGARGG